MVARHCFKVSTLHSGDAKDSVNTSITFREREMNSKLSSRERIVSSWSSTGSSTIAKNVATDEVLNNFFDVTCLTKTGGLWMAKHAQNILDQRYRTWRSCQNHKLRDTQIDDIAAWYKMANDILVSILSMFSQLIRCAFMDSSKQFC